ncbi:MAG: EpsG family protein [Bacteroidia bacterium]
MDLRKFTVGQFLLFFIWPFGSFVISVSTLHLYKSSRIIFVLFAILYGYTFVFSNEFGADNGRVVKEFYSVSEMNLNGFSEYLSSENTTDIFLPFSYYFISKISNNPQVLYAFFALIYSLFFVLSFTLLLKLIKEKRIDFRIAIFIILYIFYIRFSAINGVRFWIACFIFIYGIMKIIIDNNYWYLILIGCTPFIHFSYFFGLIIVAVYLVIGKNVNYCYILLLISVFFPVEMLNKYLKSSGFFTSKAESYFRDDNVNIEKGKRANSNFYIEWGATIAQRFMTFALFVPSFLKSNYNYDKIESRLYSFLIVFLSFLNFMSGSFEVHRRFFEIYIMLCIVFFIKILSNELIKYKSLILLDVFTLSAFVFLLPKIMLGLRSGFETLNVDLLYKSFFQITNFNTTSLYDFLLFNGLI